MSKRIKTTDSDVVVSTTTIEVVTISGVSFERDEQLQYVSIYMIGDEDKEFFEEVETPDVINIEDLKRFALNWYFNNVEIVKVTKKN